MTRQEKLSYLRSQDWYRIYINNLIDQWQATRNHSKISIFMELDPDFITKTIAWAKTPQRYEYWCNIHGNTSTLFRGDDLINLSAI